jgi:peptidoglycan/xylan/chitin deacetylase (PgdA/CDA1 family)
VLTYHTIDGGGSPVAVPLGEFERQIEQLAEGGWRTLSVDEAVSGFEQGTWPARSLLLTFDDAYATVQERALPILAKHRWTALIFVVTECVGSVKRWPWQPASVPNPRLMSWAGLKDMVAAGHCVGAHSRTHARLTDLSAADAEYEVAGSKQILEDRCGVAVKTFAYPYGACTAATEAITGRHFATAFGTGLAFVSGASPRTNLERLDAYYLQLMPSVAVQRLDGPLSRGYFAIRAVGRSLRRRSA